MSADKVQLQEALRNLIVQTLDEFHPQWRQGINFPLDTAFDTLEKWVSGKTTNYQPRTFNAFLKGLACPPERKEQLRNLYNELRNYRKPGALSLKMGDGVDKYSGVQTISIKHRADTFQALSSRARNHLMILGVGMTALSANSRERLKILGQSIKIDFLMLDPDFTTENVAFSRLVDDFFARDLFAENAKLSYHRLKLLCEEHNSNSKLPRMRLRAYRTIPSISMVLIDLEEPHGEIEVEFHIFRNTEMRPRLTVPVGGELSDVLVNSYLALWNSAHIVVE